MELLKRFIDYYALNWKTNTISLEWVGIVIKNNLMNAYKEFYKMLIVKIYLYIEEKKKYIWFDNGVWADEKDIAISVALKIVQGELKKKLLRIKNAFGHYEFTHVKHVNFYYNQQFVKANNIWKYNHTIK